MNSHPTIDDPPSILAIHPGALGDVILFGRLLSHLTGPVTLVSSAEKANLLVGLGVVASALDFDLLPMHQVFIQTPGEHCRLGDLLGKHSRLVSCFPDDEHAQRYLQNICGAASANFLPVRPPAGSHLHLLDVWAGALDINGESVRSPTVWRPPDQWRSAAADVLQNTGVPAGEPYCVLHPGAGASEKCWPIERFIELGERLKPNTRAVFILGPVEYDRWSPRDIEAIEERFTVLKAPPLSTLAGVLCHADCFVGNDSGPSHLAAVVGAPAVALFGVTNPRNFAPIGPNVKIISADSVNDIGVGEVLAAVA